MTAEDIQLSRRKLLASAGAVGAAGVGAGLGTNALLSDQETIAENSITAGTLDMTVTVEIVAANDEYLDAVNGGALIDYLEEVDGGVGAGFDLADVKPGDWVIVGIDIYVGDNPGCVTVTTEDLTDFENGRTEPEENEGGDTTGGDPGAGNGELSEHLVAEVYQNYTGSGGPSSGDPRDDLSGLDATTGSGASLADLHSTYGSGVTIGGSPGSAINTASWYLLLELPLGTGNVIQSDSVEFDTHFEAVQARNNDACGGGGDGVGECPDCSFTTGSTDDAFTNLLSVGADPSSGYPDIDARLRVDTAAGNAGDLGASDFAICENGCGQTVESVAFEPGGLVDLVVVFDETGSMGSEISGMQSNVNNLANDLNSAGIDARYALVSFKDLEILEQDFTSNVSTFHSAVDGLSAWGGGDGPEDNLDALAVGTGNAAAQDGTGASLSPFRSGAQRVVIDITDAVGSPESDGDTRFSQSDVEGFLDDGNFTYYAVTQDPPISEGDGVNKRDIADNVDDGTWIDIDGGNFGTIIDGITSDLTDPAYVVSYTTTNPATDGTVRNVDVEVDDPAEGLLYEAGSYTAPN